MRPAAALRNVPKQTRLHAPSRGFALAAVLTGTVIALSIWAAGYRTTAASIHVQTWSSSGPLQPANGAPAALAKALDLLRGTSPSVASGSCSVYAPGDTGAPDKYVLHFTRLSLLPDCWRVEVERAHPQDQTPSCDCAYPDGM